MNNKIKVSILIPCYNVEKYLEQCITSVLKQTLQDIELICINDGSTDNTLNILKSFQNKDSRIKIIDKKNTGYGDSMNRGIDDSQGEYIGIVESDDFIEPNMFEDLYNTACQENTEITRCCYYEHNKGVDTPVMNDFVIKNCTYNPNIHFEVFLQAPSVWASIYKRSWLNKNNIRFLPTPGASYQDVSFSFKAYACCKRFIMINTPYLHYRIDNQNSSIHSKNKQYCVCDEWKEIYKFIFCNKERYKNISHILPSVQCGNYKWNLCRLRFPDNLKFFIYWIVEWINRFIKKEISLNAIRQMFMCKFK